TFCADCIIQSQKYIFDGIHVQYNIKGKYKIQFIFFLQIRRPRKTTLFPYTTLFRSRPRVACVPASSRWRGGSRSRSRRCRGCTRSEEHTSELQSRRDLVCRLLLEKKKITKRIETRLVKIVRRHGIYVDYFVDVI